jgi:N-acetylglucosaminyldiphosphoundecaprenol N-acetyl-beta-D-mannosaminyltransferase
MTPPALVRIDSLSIDNLTFDETVARIAAWAEDGSGGYVCTPNVDHVVRARRDAAFRTAVAGARLRVADGMGIVYGAALAGAGLRGTVTGRLLPEAVARALGASGPPVGLFGGRAGMAAAAADRLSAAGRPAVYAVQPPMGLRIGSDEDVAAVRQLAAAEPRVVFVGLGAPKQELWMAHHSPDLPQAVLVGVGQAIDVIGGGLTPAPAWMTRLGAEWAFRLAQEPRRLAARYLWDDPRFFWWMLRARLARSRGG